MCLSAVYIGAWTGQYPFLANSASPGLVVTEWLNLSLVPEYVSIQGGTIITIPGIAFSADSASGPLNSSSSYNCVFKSNTSSFKGFSFANVRNSQMLVCETPPFPNPGIVYESAVVNFVVIRCSNTQCYDLNIPIPIILTPVVSRVFSNGPRPSLLLVDEDHFSLKLGVSHMELEQEIGIVNYRCVL
jgi:hypothetical protein